jgi:hypothetical protein
MQTTAPSISETALCSLGHEAVQMLRVGDFWSLAARFGYTLACGRTPALAIREDLADCLLQLQAEQLVPERGFSREVKFFRPNESGLIALIACVVPTNRSGNVLLELIVTQERGEARIILEQLIPML